jgi:hypothetical protein
MARRFDSRRVKFHRKPTIAEGTDILGAHKHTVSRWIAAALLTTDAKRAQWCTAKILARSCFAAGLASHGRAFQ